jgi:hypothetical protein
VAAQAPPVEAGGVGGALDHGGDHLRPDAPGGDLPAAAHRAEERAGRDASGGAEELKPGLDGAEGAGGGDLAVDDAHDTPAGLLVGLRPAHADAQAGVVDELQVVDVERGQLGAAQAGGEPEQQECRSRASWGVVGSSTATMARTSLMVSAAFWCGATP